MAKYQGMEAAMADKKITPRNTSRGTVTSKYVFKAYNTLVINANSPKSQA
jgi:hypothetical protein